MFPTFNLKSYFDWVFYGPKPLPNPPGPPDSPRDPSSLSDPNPYTEASNILILPDGRKLGYAEYGSPKGKPVVFLHGMPGSRLDASHFDDLGKELGARVIGIDRPGIGWSTPQPNRTLLSHAEDVEALTEHLKIDKFRIMGVSGGGPFALACAKALPREKLQAVSIMCGFAPLYIDTSFRGIVTWLAISILYPLVPYSVRFMFQSDAVGRIDLTDESRLQMLLQQVRASKPKNEVEEIVRTHVMKEDGSREVLRALQSCREAFSQGFYYPGLDGQLIGGSYGFRIEDIRQDLPFQLWYGTLDTMTPINHGRQIAARLGARAQLRESEDTHGSLQLRHHREAWETLLKTS